MSTAFTKLFVYRVSSLRYAPDNSEGARLYGGRWNKVGTPVIYTSSSVALATIEVIVHHGLIPADYLVIQITIPDAIEIRNVDAPAIFGAEWWKEERISETAGFGSNWAETLEAAVLQVSSAAIQNEFNYILNPLHPQFSEILFDVSSLVIDPRLHRAR